MNNTYDLARRVYLIDISLVRQQIDMLIDPRMGRGQQFGRVIAELLTRIYLTGSSHQERDEFAEYLHDVLNDCYLTDFFANGESLLVLEMIRQIIAQAFPKFKAYLPECQFQHEEIASSDDQTGTVILAVPLARLRFLQ